MDKKNEKKVLAIVAVILGVIGLILSWMPIINNVGFVFAILGVILGVISLLVNLKNKKVLSIVSLVISILACVIVLSTQSLYSKAIDDTSKKIKTDISSSQKKADDNFKWKKADYEALVVGDSLTGVGGTNYNSLESKYGKPSNSSDSSSGDTTFKNVTWDNMGSSSYKSVSLMFAKQADGSFLLSSKNQTGLE